MRFTAATHVPDNKYRLSGFQPRNITRCIECHRTKHDAWRAKWCCHILKNYDLNHTVCAQVAHACNTMFDYKVVLYFYSVIIDIIKTTYIWFKTLILWMQHKKNPLQNIINFHYKSSTIFVKLDIMKIRNTFLGIKSFISVFFLLIIVSIYKNFSNNNIFCSKIIFWYLKQFFTFGYSNKC